MQGYSPLFYSKFFNIRSQVRAANLNIMSNKKYIDTINDLVKWGKDNVDNFEENELSDGYHTFNELYDFRKMYNAALFNEWAEGYNFAKGIDDTKYSVHKSWKHFDGEDCFPNSKHRWFIVSAMLPTGLISNHYKEKDWDLFKIPEVEKALFEFDGHTGKDVLERLSSLVSV